MCIRDSAYICVQEDGESGIMVYKGANALLTSQEVMENASAFEGAAYCLLQTELNMDVIRTTVHLAHKRGVKIILKPAAVDELDEEIYQMTDIFMPNEKESARLCPGLETCEEQADLFLERGVGQVIITRGSKGCYWSDGCLLYTSSTCSSHRRHSWTNPGRGTQVTSAPKAFISSCS